MDNLTPCRFGKDLITDWEEYFPDYDICECSKGICINPLDTLVYMHIVSNTMVFTPITQHSLSYDVIGDITDNLINIDTPDYMHIEKEVRNHPNGANELIFKFYFIDEETN